MTPKPYPYPHPPSIPDPSALTSLISSSSHPSTPLSATTLQVLHNLQHQHLWTSLKVDELQTTFPASVLSGIPPHRVYTHPDEQLYMLERGLREDDVELERMYVLPTVQGQSWTLGKMADIFDALPDPAGEGEWEAEAEAHNGVDETETEAEQASTQATKAAKLAEYYEYRRTALRTQEWGGKRLLLAMIDKGMGGDGTVVYYVVQEGAVKPRQN